MDSIFVLEGPRKISKASFGSHHGYTEILAAITEVRCFVNDLKFSNSTNSLAKPLFQVLAHHCSWFTDVFDRMNKDSAEVRWRQLSESDAPETAPLPDVLEQRCVNWGKGALFVL